MSPLILIVEDEPELSMALEYNLQREGFKTRAALDGTSALALSRQAPLPDLILLDLMLPDLAGTEVCRQLRADPETSGIPIVMVTARSEEIDRVVGFELGADDYVTKPFSTRELVLRIRAVLRRSSRPEGDEPPQAFGLIRLDPGAHRAWVEDQELTLTALEFRLLSILLNRRGRVQSRTRLLEDVWEEPASVTHRTVDTHIKRLRQKLGPANAYIQTIRGVGYRFVSDPSEGST